MVVILENAALSCVSVAESSDEDSGEGKSHVQHIEGYPENSVPKFGAKQESGQTPLPIGGPCHKVMIVNLSKRAERFGNVAIRELVNQISVGEGS